MATSTCMGLAALVVAVCAPVSFSQTLNWGSLTNSTIVDSQGMPLDQTFVFELGAFDPGFTPTELNIGQWSNHWHAFDKADYAYNPVDLGYFTGTENLQDVSGYASMFEGMAAYLWVRNNNQTEQFLATTASWSFPALDTGCCATDVTTWSVSDLVTDTPLWGSHDDLHGGGNHTAPGPFDLQTHAVPEPGALLLALPGCCSLLLRRRRHRA